MMVKQYFVSVFSIGEFESSVNLYDGQTGVIVTECGVWFESSVNLYDGQTALLSHVFMELFESSVNLYDGQTRGGGRKEGQT